MNAAEAAAVQQYPELRHLLDFRDAGWLYLQPHVEGGLPVQLDGFRAWPNGWMDVIRVRDRGDVIGIRLNSDAPPGLVWERTGSLKDVAEALLTLPPPGDRLAPRLVVGRAPRIWVPS